MCRGGREPRLEMAAKSEAFRQSVAEFDMSCGGRRIIIREPDAWIDKNNAEAFFACCRAPDDCCLGGRPDLANEERRVNQKGTTTFELDEPLGYGRVIRLFKPTVD